MCIQTEQFRFLDVMNFLGGLTYSPFVKAYYVEECNRFFPYNFSNEFSKLQETKLPEYKHFYSTLKGCNVLGETMKNYQYLQKVWNENNMKTF